MLSPPTSRSRYETAALLARSQICLYRLSISYGNVRHDSDHRTWLYTNKQFWDQATVPLLVAFLLVLTDMTDIHSTAIVLRASLFLIGQF